jgi:hypothetical protein
MSSFLQENNVYISHNPKFREYSIRARSSKIIVQEIYYCPWCGIKPSSSLRDKFFDILRNEYKLDIDIFETKKAPKGFQTDEWWRKRGL